MADKVKLGDRVRYKIDGFEGIVTGIVDYLYQCKQVFVRPETRDKDGKVLDGHWFDMPWVEVVKAGVHKAEGAIEVVQAGKKVRTSGAPGRETPNMEGR
jgi:hypothetical protein